MPGVDFLEVVPDNWMGLGGQSAETLQTLAGHYPMVAHGLSLSIGDAQDIDWGYLRRVREFLDAYRIDVYSDHLSASRDDQGYMYELVPVPRSAASARHIADKVRRVQEYLGRRLSLENVSSYYRDPHEMAEGEFIAMILQMSGCALLLDINNVYVNSINFNEDPNAFLQCIPEDAVSYYHIAGHAESAGCMPLLDTHGSDVCEEVVDLGKSVVARFGMRPLVLERDNNVPPLPALCDELQRIYASLLQQEGSGSR